MTGWTPNQMGCYYYGRYTHFKKKWRNFQGTRKPQGKDLHDHALLPEKLQDDEPTPFQGAQNMATQLERTDNH